MDFARGLNVCAKPGHEFASVGSSGMLVSLIATQGFAMLFLVPVLAFFVLRNVVGAPTWVAVVSAVALAVPILVGGIWLLLHLNQGRGKSGAYLKNESDSRFRVRVVIPKKRQNAMVMRWVDAAVHGEVREEGDKPITADDLEMVRGGFDPIVFRPLFGVKREARFWRTAMVMGLISAMVLLGLISLLLGGWREVLSASGFMGYAITGGAMVGGVVCAEFMWPVYIRLVPGRLDVFRYGFLGSGEARVETHDLKKQGVCVDYGSYVASIEPERPVGETLPALVQGKRWPHGQTLPDDFRPFYFSVAMTPGRREIAQRVIQAARTDEATPPVSEHDLGE